MHHLSGTSSHNTRNQLSKPVVLNLWVKTPLEVKLPFHRGYLRHWNEQLIHVHTHAHTHTHVGLEDRERERKGEEDIQYFSE